MSKHEWKTLEQLQQELEFFIVSKAPAHIIEEAALAVGACRIRDAIDEEVMASFTSTGNGVER
jgi:hypothetical protein